MFTPPPSPQPPRTKSAPSDPNCSPPELRDCDKGRMAQEEFLRSVEAKQRTSRRFRRAVLLVPLFVIALTFCGSYFSHIAFLDNHSEAAVRYQWRDLLQDPSVWSLHKREPLPQGQSSSSSSQSPAPTTTLPSQTSQPLPTVPGSPPTLPTPFPQAFDAKLQQNFSSASCLSFFTNMTNSPSFRSCRPFSLLLDSSSTFLNAQQNLTLLNNLVWGTCNTNTSFQQCQGNMDWFADTIKTACSVDLQARSALVQGTLVALQAFSLMHDVACQQDPTSNSYCFVNAARSSNPTDLYYYQLPLGTALPSTSTPSCSACSKSIMGLYANALKDANQRAMLPGLVETYDSSAQISVQFCTASFAPTKLVGAALSTLASLPSVTAWAMWLGSVWTALMVIS